MCTCVYVYRRRKYICIHDIFVHTCVRMSACIVMCICVYVCMCICVHMWELYMCTCAHAYIFGNFCIHTYEHMYIYPSHPQDIRTYVYTYISYKILYSSLFTRIYPSPPQNIRTHVYMYISYTLLYSSIYIHVHTCISLTPKNICTHV